MFNLSGIKDSVMGFFQTIKSYVTNWIISLHIDTYKAIQIVSVFGIGFFTAFFLRRFFREFFLIICASIVVLFVLQYFAFVNINWVEIRSIINVQPTDTLESVFSMLSGWVNERIIYVISFFIGFFIGTRVG